MLCFVNPSSQVAYIFLLLTIRAFRLSWENNFPSAPDNKECTKLYYDLLVAIIILQPVETLLSNDREISKYTRAVTGHHASQTKQVPTETI
jgi:hypothetical protein